MDALPVARILQVRPRCGKTRARTMPGAECPPDRQWPRSRRRATPTSPNDGRWTRVAPSALSLEQGARGLPAGHHVAEAAPADGASIDHDVGAVDEGRFVTGQVDGRVDDVVGNAGTR